MNGAVGNSISKAMPVHQSLVISTMIHMSISITYHYSDCVTEI